MRSLIVLAAILFLFSCNSSDSTPDVSDIKVDLTIKRFDKDFFSMDTTNLDTSLTVLGNKYPEFFGDFLEKFLGISGEMVKNGEAKTIIRSFYNSYDLLYDSAQQIFGDFSAPQKEIKKALQYVKYYFPAYHLPVELITFIAPMDASFKTSFGLQGDIINGSFLGVGLQLHMGKSFSFYQSEQGQELYPSYISSRFEPNTIAANCMKNIVDDMFPEKIEDRSLIQQMVEKGKRLYLLSKFLPGTQEYILIGYTQQQMKECYENEQGIWNLFVQNNFLQTIDNNIIKNYIGESPKTQELGDASPGNIGAFAGWQIVKKYMNKNPKLTVQQLMNTEADIIFEQAKYKP